MEYLNNRLPKGLIALFTAKTILMAASGLLGLFLPIFLYKLFGNNFQYAMLYYGVSSLIYALLVPLGALYLYKFGFRNALFMSSIWGALFYVAFYFTNVENAFYLIPLSILILTLNRICYWLPYHVDFAILTNKSERGKQFSVFESTRNILSGLIPILSGFLVARFGFDSIFAIAVILFAASSFSYLKVPRTNEVYSWSYKQTWQEFFHKKNRKTVFAFMADGAEGIVGMIVWPIFIYELLKGDILQVGILSSLIIVVTVIAQIALGKYIDKKKENKEGILKWGSSLYSIGWVFKIFIFTAFHIFVVGVYHNLMKIFLRTPFDVLTYEIAADQGHYVDEFTVMHEMAIHFGKVLAVISAIILSLFLPLQWTFGLAALAAISFNLLRSKHAFHKI